MKTKSLLFIYLLFIIPITQAQVQFTASSKRLVQVGERFRVNFSVNGNSSEFSSPRISNFRVLSGPSTSTSTSFQSINGKTSQKTTITYSYILEATSVGKFTIPAASIKVKGRKYVSNTLEIEVVKGKTAESIENTESESTDKNSLFLRISVNKSTVYRGEPLVATIKLYTQRDIVRLEDMKFPTFDGFLSQDLKQVQQITLKQEKVNDQIYHTAVLGQYLLFPQRSGDLKISKAELELVINEKAGKIRNFFGEIVDNYRPVRKRLISTERKITVKNLPATKSPLFIGTVGRNMKLEATINQGTEGINYNIRISGNGNHKLIDEFSINFPNSFEIYTPEIQTNIKNTNAGASGSKTFKYLLLPRSSGDFVIPTVEFVYFDLDSKSYKTLSTKEFEVHIDQSESMPAYSNMDSTNLTSEEIASLDKDIRHIHENAFKLYKNNTTIIKSNYCLLIILILLVIFISILIVRRNYIKLNANEILVRNRRANKESRKRLKKAAVHIQRKEKSAFYTEILQALWGYLSDKLTIDVADLNKKEMANQLSNRGIEQSKIDECIAVLDECEFAQYAPVGSNDKLANIYKRASDIIKSLEQALRPI